MALPLMLDWIQAQTRWKSQIDPVLASPVSNMSVIKNIALINGTTIINHKLGQMQQGWTILDINGAATIYRNAPFNNLTLSLSSNAAVNVNIGVF
jgi:hypothetical protein